jgi:hypothetical protein
MKIRRSIRIKYLVVKECGKARLKWKILQEHLQEFNILNKLQFMRIAYLPLLAFLFI